MRASELAPEAAAHVLRDLLAPFPRSRLIRAAAGPADRPSVAVLHFFRLRVDDALDEYIAVASRQPPFELRPIRIQVAARRSAYFSLTGSPTSSSSSTFAKIAKQMAADECIGFGWPS